ncbi:MAG: hypothetical protein COB66_01095 [Coxiella sp. (in: Bacteria)]|nr:MAG: hypothetical protein COB66_01095 [Coxiella sp. (in: g-proteobacteria)]
MIQFEIENENPIRKQIGQIIADHDGEVTVERAVTIITLSFDKIIEQLALVRPGVWEDIPLFEDKYDDIKGVFRIMLQDYADLLLPHFNYSHQVLTTLMEKYQSKRIVLGDKTSRINNILIESKAYTDKDFSINTFPSIKAVSDSLWSCESELRAARLDVKHVFTGVISSATAGGSISAAMIAASGAAFTVAALTPIVIGIGAGLGLLSLLYAGYESYRYYIVSNRIGRLSNLYNGQTKNELLRSKLVSRIICECLGEIAEVQLNRDNEHIEVVVGQIP